MKYKDLENEWSQQWFQFIKNNPDKPWDWDYLSLNPNVTWDVVQANLDKPWVWDWLSENPNLTRDVICLLYTSPSPRDGLLSRMPSSA